MKKQFSEMKLEFGRRLRATVKARQQAEIEADTPNSNTLPSHYWLANKVNESLGIIYSNQEDYDKYSVSPATASNWLKGVNIPKLPILREISIVLQKPITWLLDVEVYDYPIVKLDQNEYIQKRASLFKNVTDELYVQLRAGGTINWNGVFPILEDTVKRNPDFRVKLLISNPNDKNTVAFIAERRALGAKNTSRVSSDINFTVDNFKELGCAMDIMYVPHAPSSLVFIADPEKNRGEALALILNFKGKFVLEAPMIHATKKEHHALFDFYKEDFERLWDYGEAHK